MGEIFGAILDAIGESIKNWAKKTGKPVFGIGCIVVGVLCFIWLIRWGKDYSEYLTKPGRFSVEESISYEDLTEKGTTVVKDKREHEYRVKHWYEVDGQKFEYEDRQKGNPAGSTHYFWRDEDGVAHEVNVGSPFLLLLPGVLCVLAILFGVLDIRQFREKHGTARQIQNRKKKSREEARAIVELNKRDRERELEQQKKDS